LFKARLDRSGELGLESSVLIQNKT
jgi:hypothetical protein